MAAMTADPLAVITRVEAIAVAIIVRRMRLAKIILPQINGDTKNDRISSHSPFSARRIVSSLVTKVKICSL
jgi:hypothetical protein